MARVNISKQLKEEVTELCNVRANKEREALGGRGIRMALSNARYSAEDIEPIFFIDAPHLYDALPQNWLIPFQRVGMRVLDSPMEFAVPDGVHIPAEARDSKIIFEATEILLNRPLRVPAKYKDAYKLNLYVSLSHPMLRDHADHIRELFAIQAEVVNANVKWKEVQEQVLAFLDSQPSLNAALKKWEGLAHFIPDKYLRKVEEQVARRVAQNDADAVQIDTTRLEVVAVTAKLTGA